MSEGLGTILFCGGIILISGAVQELLCFVAKKKVFKCVPIYIAALVVLLGLLVMLGVFGDMPLGDIELHQFVGAIILFYAGIAAAGVALAWGIYGAILYARRKKGKQ